MVSTNFEEYFIPSKHTLHRCYEHRHVSSRFAVPRRKCRLMDCAHVLHAVSMADGSFAEFSRFATLIRRHLRNPADCFREHMIAASLEQEDSRRVHSPGHGGNIHTANGKWNQECTSARHVYYAPDLT